MAGGRKVIGRKYIRIHCNKKKHERRTLIQENGCIGREQTRNAVYIFERGTSLQSPSVIQNAVYEQQRQNRQAKGSAANSARKRGPSSLKTKSANAEVESKFPSRHTGGITSTCSSDKSTSHKWANGRVSTEYGNRVVGPSEGPRSRQGRAGGV
jgi:hypothetical protein